MHIGVLTLCYNDEKNLKACIKNWQGLIDKHLVLVSEKPWHGPEYELDNSYKIAIEMGVDAVLGRWQNEAEQRNWGLAYLYNYDYVLIIDSDEFFTRKDQEIILKFLNETSWVPVAYPKNTIVYWKTPDYVLSPTDIARLILVVDPKSVLFKFARNADYINGSTKLIDHITYVNITSHHFSYVRTDKQILQKLTSYEHSNTLNNLDIWYENVWSKWKPGSDILVRSQGIEKSRAIYSPAPLEIQQLFE